MLYSFPIGTSTVQVDVSDGLQQTIIDVILSNGRVYINQLARLVNASQREVYYAVSDLRKAWLPLVGDSSWVYFTNDTQVLKDYIKRVQKRNIEILKDSTQIIKALSNTANLQMQLVHETEMPKRPWLKNFITKYLGLWESKSK